MSGVLHHVVVYPVLKTRVADLLVQNVAAGLNGNDGVAVAVENLHGAHAGIYKVHRAGVLGSLLHGRRVASQQGAAVGLLHAVPAELGIGELLLLNLHVGHDVRGAEHVAAGLHLVGVLLVLSALAAVLGVHGCEGRQMAAGGAAEHADSLRIDLILRRVGPQEADGRLHVDELVREMSLGAAAVVDGGHYIAGSGKLAHLAQHHVLVRSSPAAAGNPHQGRLGAVILLGIVLAGGQAHLAVAVLNHDAHLELHGISVQVLLVGVHNVVDQVDGLLGEAGVNDFFHNCTLPFIIFLIVHASSHI